MHDGEVVHFTFSTQQSYRKRLGRIDEKLIHFVELGMSL